jgi:hypothetical protein
LEHEASKIKAQIRGKLQINNHDSEANAHNNKEKSVTEQIFIQTNIPQQQQNNKA